MRWIEEDEVMMATSHHQQKGNDVSEAIAIIGMASKFPSDATDTKSFWKFLLNGRCAHSSWPAHRIGAGHYHPDSDHGGSHAVSGGHFLKDDPTNFDAPFFSITKGEAVSMDPQQRLVLENVYHALENAGISLAKASGTDTSVFVSGFNHDHLALLSADMEANLRHRATGLTNSILSNRVSWFFDFKGPSMTIDTACSSSLVTLHQACQSLRSGESRMAISTGVTVINHPNDIISMSYQGFLGNQGKCFAFDHRAEGYARGEGVGTIVLKRLTDAIRDENTIRAVIRGTGVNQDGRTPGLTLPDSGAQEKLIKKVYATAGLDFHDTHMIEAHGTGTSAGDPVEANGIARAFSTRRKNIPLTVGALKSGTGHLEGAAGAASVIKSVLILENGIIPPNVNFEKINPKIPAKRWNLHFPVEPLPWPTEGLRRISVNSFGVGGTNAHCILDDALNFLREHGIPGKHHTRYSVPTRAEIENLLSTVGLSSESDYSAHDSDLNGQVEKERNRGSIYPSIRDHAVSTNGSHSTTGEHPDWCESHWASFRPIIQPPKLLPITAFDEQGISRIANVQASFLKPMPQINEYDKSTFVSDYVHTLSQRSKFPWRSYILAKSSGDLLHGLSSVLPKAIRARTSVNLGFVFTGQGAQWYGMGRELLCYPIFRESLESCSAYLHSLGAKWSLLEELAQSKSNSRINEAWLAQPACTAIQIATIDLLDTWGILPERAVGHSSGEIAAAYCAGLLDKHSAWKIAYFRGLVSAKPTVLHGAMLAVGLGRDAILPYLILHDEGAGELVVACINSPKSSTISGNLQKIEALRQALETDGIFARRLNVTNAYHSAYMKHVAEEYRELLGDLRPSKPRNIRSVSMFSSVTGSVVRSDFLGADYWVENLVSPVQFCEALAALCFTRVQDKQTSLAADTTGAIVFADVLLELGPHGALQSAIKDTLASRPEGEAITSFAVLNRSAPGAETLLSTIGHLHSRGYPIDVQVINESSCVNLKDYKRPRLLHHVPGYPFKHSEHYWYESRLSRNFRLRKHPRHDLFGAPVADWNASSPRWRNILRISEQPWLQQHVVTNAIILPGVWYIVAAIEAARQITDPQSTITGFRLRDINLKRALVIPDTKDGVEVVLNFNPMDESSLAPSSTWRKFIILSYNVNGDDWIEHCTGYIAVDYDIAPPPVDGGREAKEEAEAWCSFLKKSLKICNVSWDFVKQYENLLTVGLKFGPLFQNLSAVSGTANHDGEVMGTVTVPNIAQLMPKNYLSPHLIHPTTMDSFLHLSLASIIDATGKNNLEVPMVPRFIENVWISAELNAEPGHTYRAHAKAHMVAYGKYESDIKVWDGSTDEPRIEIQGVEATPLDATGQSLSESRKLCHKLESTPYLETVSASDFAEAAKASPGDVEAKVQENCRLQLASLLLIHDALKLLQTATQLAPEGHLSRYLEWMNHVTSELKQDHVFGVSRRMFDQYESNCAAKAKLYRLVEQESANGALAVRMGTNIVPVLQGKVDPLHLMFGQDDILDRVYGQVAVLNQLPSQQRAYLNIVSSNCENLQVLEVGAGVGSSTVGILESLAPVTSKGQRGRCIISTYTYTDVSAAFFEKAKEKFKHYRDIMEFKVLDAARDVANQGYQLGSYDVVVAQNVVHATADLRFSLTNLRKLLRPGGRLILQEGIRQDCYWSGIAFGQLPGWWLGVETTRQWSPWVSSQQWVEILKSSGYTEQILELPDSTDSDLHTQSLFVAQIGQETLEGEFPWGEVMLVTSSFPEHSPGDIVRRMGDCFKSVLGVKTITIMPLSQLKTANYSQCLCVSLVELERPVIAQMSQTEYEGIQQLMTVSKGALWITGDTFQVPEFGAIIGLMRSNRWERDLDDVNLITLSIAEPRPADESVVESIIRLCRQQFSGSLPQDQYHGEYTLQNKTLLISRLNDAERANSFLQAAFSKPKPVMIPAKDAGRPIKLSAPVPGILDTLEWVTDEAYYTPLAETEVEVEIKAVSLNFRDLMIAMGEHASYSMGSEAAGIISRTGAKVTNFRPGDRVVYICGMRNVGCMNTFGRLDQSTVVKIPPAMTFEVASGLPVVCATVIYSLREAGRLQRGEKILIHAAAGGVGQAAIQYAQWVGAEIFATVSTLEKRDLLIHNFDIPVDHIFSSRDLTFAKGIKRVTNGYGVDVVLNSLSGEALRQSWSLIAPFGRFVEIGKRDAQMNGRIELRPYLQNVTMTSVDLVTMMIHRPVLIKQLTEDTIKLWEQGVFKPATPLTVIPMAQVVDGLRTLQSGKGMGKIIMVPREDDVLPIIPAQPAPYHFRADVSYLLSGGLGGIGRSIAKWMVSRGARHLIFASSSGRITEVVKKMQEELEASGCGVYIFKCDVGDKESLQSLLDQCRQTLPPIKGVIQGAMKLKDCMFENMSYETFQLAIKPKIQGSWNLHELLPRDLDHFVMLSSATGVLGNRSQANYAAGNTYQDALACHRRLQGLAATTIDLGTVLSVGYVAENRERVAMAKHLGVILEVIREEELHNLIEYALDPRCESPAQLVTGLTTSETYRARGVPPPTYLNYPLFRHLTRLSNRTSISVNTGDGPVVETLLGSATTFDEAAAIVEKAILSKLSSLLSVPTEDINVSRSVSANGVDSLVALEFRAFLAREIKADVPMLDIMDTASIHQLSRKIVAVSSAVDIEEGNERGPVAS
ncbi:MAG: hypothetical protein FE78DRAFT_30538 [Acidomyces sp. 'richmondensis']|nr:MAG: hypothetical protein FE78DRAFT_30538 [Acidomyces sp. 'richmondensis']